MCVYACVHVCVRGRRVVENGWVLQGKSGTLSYGNDSLNILHFHEQHH